MYDIGRNDKFENYGFNCHYQRDAFIGEQTEAKVCLAFPTIAPQIAAVRVFYVHNSIAQYDLMTATTHVVRLSHVLLRDCKFIT